MRKGFALYINELYKIIHRKGFLLICVALILLPAIASGLRYLSGNIYSASIVNPEKQITREAALEYDTKTSAQMKETMMPEQDKDIPLKVWIIEQFHNKRIPVLQTNYAILYDITEQALQVRDDETAIMMDRKELEPWFQKLTGKVETDTQTLYDFLKGTKLQSSQDGRTFLRTLEQIHKEMEREACPDEPGADLLWDGRWSEKLQNLLPLISEKIQFDEALDLGYVPNRLSLSTMVVSTTGQREDLLTLQRGTKVEGALRTCVEAQQKCLQAQLDQADRIDPAQSFLSTFYVAQVLSTLVLCICIISLAGANISGELTSGTVKALIINPVKRGKIVVAKALSLLTLLVLGTLFVFACCYGFSGLFEGGFPQYSLQYYSGGSLQQISIGYTCFMLVCSNALNGLCIAVLAWMFSSLIRNTAVAVSLGVAAYLLREFAVLISVVAYRTPFAWLNPYVHLSLFKRWFPIVGNFLRDEGNPSFSVLMVKPEGIYTTVYIVLLFISFFWIAYDSFVRRDIQ